MRPQVSVTSDYFNLNYHDTVAHPGMYPSSYGSSGGSDRMMASDPDMTPPDVFPIFSLAGA
jgi:hypothetical protein